jgi:hypothetical protein
MLPRSTDDSGLNIQGFSVEAREKELCKEDTAILLCSTTLY